MLSLIHISEQHRANDHDERGNRDLEATAAVHEAARRPHVGQGAHLVGGVEDADRLVDRRRHGAQGEGDREGQQHAPIDVADDDKRDLVGPVPAHRDRITRRIHDAHEEPNEGDSPEGAPHGARVVGHASPGHHHLGAARGPSHQAPHEADRPDTHQAVSYTHLCRQ